VLRHYHLALNVEYSTKETCMQTQEYIEIGGKKIKYALRRDRRAKRFRVTLHDDGHCTVTVPRPYGRPAAERFLLSHVDWLKEKMRDNEGNTRKLLSGYSNRKEYLRLREKSRDFISREVERCNALYGFTHTGLSIRNQRSRWGSCSSNGRLSFHYKLILLPRKLARYVIVHELCHLKELNHSSRFWALVEKAFPDYKELKKELTRW